MVCPNPACSAEIDFDASLLGKNSPCPACGQVITVVPMAYLTGRTKERERLRRAGEGRELLPIRAILEDIRSLWNVGSMFRTSDACGVERLYLCGITGRPPRKEISKTALGAEAAVPWTHLPSALAAAREARAEGCHVVAGAGCPERAPWHAFEFPFPLCLVVGNEVAGVSEKVLREAEAAVHVPMMGTKRSLNVAVAYGVVACRAASAWTKSRAAKAGGG